MRFNFDTIFFGVLVIVPIVATVALVMAPSGSCKHHQAPTQVARKALGEK